MELRHLRYFVAVAEELHFGRAAARLFMAQPPLSQQIRQLEQEIGVDLFTRTNRRVQLTEGGQVFLEEARGILERVDQAVGRARRASLGEAGWFGVGFVASATYDILPAILREFRERLPAVELVLLELLGGEQGQALRDHRIHVGFARVPKPEEGILFGPVTRDALVAALPAWHRLAARERVSLSELAAEPFILYPDTPDSGYSAYIFDLFDRMASRPTVVQKAGEMQTAVSLVAAGIGFTLVPASVQNLRREGVVYRPLREEEAAIELTMAYRTDETSPILPRFLEIVRETVRKGE